MQAFLTAWLSAPPSDRLAATFRHYGAEEEGVRTFEAYDRWIATMQDAEARASALGVRVAWLPETSRPDPRAC